MATATAALVPPAASAAKFPGYENRDSYPYFATPSGRIVCGYYETRGYRVECTDYSTGQTADGETGQRLWSVRSRGRARAYAILANAPSEDLPRARYGVTYRYHGIVCRIHPRRGITCRNRSGHGFTVSVQKKRVF